MSDNLGHHAPRRRYAMHDLLGGMRDLPLAYFEDASMNPIEARSAWWKVIDRLIVEAGEPKP